ncbi:MAG TPA: type III pantothenate kinase [Mycobacteriales bacterium]|nr:type III pantothenate kinase [Mycobacteriales bacterium]
MLLTIDVGNTNTVIGYFDGEILVESWRIKTDTRATADELALLLRGLLVNSPPPDGISACSTVPAVLHELRGVFARYYEQVPALIVEPGVKTGVPLLIDNPREAGADRVVNTLAAHTLFGGPAIVVDFGTATNFDVVSAKGEYLGGPIAPGIELSIDALALRGAQLRKVELTRPRAVIGKTTVECLQSGVIYGFAGLIDGLVHRISDELDADPVVIATGGLAPMVIDECETVTEYEPDLTLIGLRLVFDRNRV